MELNKEQAFILKDYYERKLVEIDVFLGHSRFVVPKVEVVEKVKKSIPNNKSKGYNYWTSEEDKILLELRSSGKTHTYIAAKLGRSEQSTQTRCKKLNITKETIKAANKPAPKPAPTPDNWPVKMVPDYKNEILVPEKRVR